MKRKVLLAVAVLALLVWSDPKGLEDLSGLPRAHAQSGGYDLTWHTVDGGGATFSTSGDYQLGSTVGQPDAGVLSSGGYTLVGGFWGGAAVRYRIYLPLVLRQSP